MVFQGKFIFRALICAIALGSVEGAAGSAFHRRTGGEKQRVPKRGRGGWPGGVLRGLATAAALFQGAHAPNFGATHENGNGIALPVEIPQAGGLNPFPVLSNVENVSMGAWSDPVHVDVATAHGPPENTVSESAAVDALADNSAEWRWGTGECSQNEECWKPHIDWLVRRGAQLNAEEQQRKAQEMETEEQERAAQARAEEEQRKQQVAAEQVRQRFVAAKEKTANFGKDVVLMWKLGLEEAAAKKLEQVMSPVASPEDGEKALAVLKEVEKVDREADDACAKNREDCAHLKRVAESFDELVQPLKEKIGGFPPSLSAQKKAAVEAAQQKAVEQAADMALLGDLQEVAESRMLGRFVDPVKEQALQDRVAEQRESANVACQNNSEDCAYRQELAQNSEDFYRQFARTGQKSAAETHAKEEERQQELTTTNRWRTTNTQKALEQSPEMALTLDLLDFSESMLPGRSVDPVKEQDLQDRIAAEREAANVACQNNREDCAYLQKLAQSSEDFYRRLAQVRQKSAARSVRPRSDPQGAPAASQHVVAHQHVAFVGVACVVVFSLLFLA